MKRLLLFALVCVLAPLAGRAQTAVSGNLKDVGVANASGSNTYVRFTLIDYGAQIPKITNLSGNLIFNPIKDFKPDANGIISGTIQGNDTITPPATKYQVCVYYQGAVFRCNTYIINGATFNLNTATPLNTSVQAGANQLVVFSYPFTQATPSSTWTIPHNFNDPNSYVQVFDTNHGIIYPDHVSTLDPNNAVLTFVTPTAGFAIAMHAGSINIATNQPNAVVSNPTGSQTIGGAPLSISAPVTFSGPNSHSGTEIFSGPLLPQSVGGATFFADSLIPSIGLCNVSGFDASTKIQCAINLLPPAGGVVNAIALTDVGGTGSTTIDPGIKAVTVYLGPTTFHFSQTVLRRAFRMIGSGAYPGNGTIIQATGGNSIPPFVIDQGTEATQGVILRGFALTGTAGNTTQNGINVIAQNGLGLWYSEFDDIFITGFGGIGLNLDGQVNNSANQFDTFKRITVLRNFNGNFALQVIGFANSLKFENVEFDGQLNTQDGLTNINIAQGTNSVFVPYNIKFDLLTCQFAGKCFVINGGESIETAQGHFENIQQVYAVGTGAGFGSLGITIHDSDCINNCGVGTASPGVGIGNGYFIKNLGATPNVSISVINTHLGNTPDAFLAGNTGSIVSFGNTIGPEGSYAYQPFQPNTPNGFGNGAAGTAVTTTLLGTGSGPATPQTIVKYLQVTLSGTTYWIPVVQ